MTLTCGLELFCRREPSRSRTVNDFTFLPNTPAFLPIGTDETPDCDLSIDIFNTYDEARGFKAGYERAISGHRWSMALESLSDQDRPVFVVLIVDENSADDCIRIADHRAVLSDATKVQCASLTSTNETRLVSRLFAASEKGYAGFCKGA